MCRQLREDDAFSLRHPQLEIFDWDAMDWEPFDNYEVIDLTADSELDSCSSCGSDEDDPFMDNYQHAYCRCGQELDVQECRHNGHHQCRDCLWYDQLSDEEWAAISALMESHTHQNESEQ